MADKNRVLLIRDYLEDHSDKKHPVSTAELRAFLQKKGCPVTIQTLRTDILSLQNTGYKIKVTEESGKSTTYYWVSRKWTEPEVQILTDTVSSSLVLTNEKSRTMIEKLSALGGPSVQEQLLPPIMISERIKAENEDLLEIVLEIRKAIRLNRKIRFDYYHYGIRITEKEDKSKKKIKIIEIIRTAEKRHVVSPYATIWNNDRYYMVGWSDERNKINVYRIDRMGMAKIMDSRKREPEPEKFRVQDYTDQIFGMYEGDKKTNVTFRCRHKILDQVIDKFGKGIQPKNITATTFDFTVPISVSGTFFGWVLQFVGQMNLIAPEGVIEEYQNYLEQALDNLFAAN